MTLSKFSSVVTFSNFTDKIWMYVVFVKVLCYNTYLVYLTLSCLILALILCYTNLFVSLTKGKHFFSELKAEVEKLRAAQMSSQGVEPERVRLFQQEISTLRSKLCQQEREMAEANRSVSWDK